MYWDPHIPSTYFYSLHAYASNFAKRKFTTSRKRGGLLLELVTFTRVKIKIASVVRLVDIRYICIWLEWRIWLEFIIASNHLTIQIHQDIRASLLGGVSAFDVDQARFITYTCTPFNLTFHRDKMPHCSAIKRLLRSYIWRIIWRGAALLYIYIYSLFYSILKIYYILRHSLKNIIMRKHCRP